MTSGIESEVEEVETIVKYVVESSVVALTTAKGLFLSFIGVHGLSNKGAN